MQLNFWNTFQCTKASPFKTFTCKTEVQNRNFDVEILQKEAFKRQYSCFSTKFWPQAFFDSTFFFNFFNFGQLQDQKRLRFKEKRTCISFTSILDMMKDIFVSWGYSRVNIWDVRDFRARNSAVISSKFCSSLKRFGRGSFCRAFIEGDCGHIEARSLSNWAALSHIFQV